MKHLKSFEAFNINLDDKSKTVAGSIVFVTKRIKELKSRIASPKTSEEHKKEYERRLKRDEAYLKELQKKKKK